MENKPGVDENATFTVHRDKYGYPGMIASYGKVKVRVPPCRAWTRADFAADQAVGA